MDRGDHFIWREPEGGSALGGQQGLDPALPQGRYVGFRGFEGNRLVRRGQNAQDLHGILGQGRLPEDPQPQPGKVVQRLAGGPILIEAPEAQQASAHTAEDRRLAFAADASDSKAMLLE